MYTYVKKKYRGHGLGLFMVDAAVNVINSDMSLTLLKPFPLQHESRNTSNDYQSTDIPLEIAKKKLVDYYKKYGFAEVELLGEGVEVKLLGIWNGYRIPELTDVVPQLKKFM